MGSVTARARNLGVAPGSEPGVERQANIEFEVVRDLAGLHALADDWRALAARTKNVFGYFQTYEWCERWLAVYGAEGGADSLPRAHVLTGRVDGDPVLIWPLVEDRASMGLTVLKTLGEPHGQYAGVLADPGPVGHAAIVAGWAHIRSGPGIDAIELTNIPHGSVLAEALSSDAGFASSGDSSAVLDLTHYESWDAFFQSLSASCRKSRRRKRRKLEALGALEFRVHSPDSPGFTEAVASALDLKTVWLRESGKASRALSMDNNAAFFSGLTDCPAGAGRVLVGELALDGRMIAGEIGFERNGHFISYLGAYDLALYAHSPGKVEMECMLEWCFENGIRCYDLLGNSDAYKEAWSNTDVPLFNHHVGLTVLGRARVELWLKRLRPALKQSIEALPREQRIRVLSALGTRLYASGETP
ncbi:MAG: GNAT family N-acetyltransferase [Pseudomonadota bacterium]